MQRAREFTDQWLTAAPLARFGLSVLVAVLLWGWVTQLQDPVETDRYAEINITPPELPGTIEIVTSLPRASVILRDVESRLSTVERSDITVSLDTSDIDGPGTFEVPLIGTTTSDIRDLDVSPDTLSIQVEEVVSENFPLTVENQVMVNDARRIVDISPDVSEVTVTGAQSAVDRIERVVLPVSVDRQSRDFTDTITPYAVDDKNQRVQEVAILPQQVRTDVDLETRGKPVSVVPQVTGTPADGFVVQQQVSVPQTIVVDGPDAVLESLLFVNTAPVDISDATESLSKIVPLEALPEGVTIVEPSEQEVEVRVSVASASGTANEIPNMPIKVRGLQPGYSAEIDPEVAKVSVSASAESLSGLTAEDITVFVDAEGLGPGAHTISIEADVPDDVTVSLIEPREATVVITVQDGTPGSAAMTADRVGISSQ
jgi:YbbR domain-containing protein